MSPLVHRLIVRALAVALAALALYPLAQIGRAWVEFTNVVGLGLEESPPRGFDGVRWEPASMGGVVAAYVFPQGPAAAAGIREGDRLESVDLRPALSPADVEREAERATGTVLTYSVVRAGDAPGAVDLQLDVDVRVGRYPTFLYPIQDQLWMAAAWGFALVAFLHVLAYLTVAPLATRSPRARRSQWLIGAALVWVAGNLVRIVWVEVWGPPAGAGWPGALFDALTLVALGGWILYPLLLLDQGIRASRQVAGLGAARWVLVVPASVLAVGVTVATVRGHVGPLPPDAFAVPILFYVCVYVAAATALVLLRPPRPVGPDAAPPARWSRAGSALVFVLSVVGAVVAASRVAPGPQDDAVWAGWVAVTLQLFSLLPVALVSLSTLRYGQFDALLVRGLTTVATLAAAFLAVAIGSFVLGAVLPGGANPIALGVLVVALLLVAERTAPLLREWAQRAFRTERYQARRALDRLGDRIRFILDVDALATETSEAVGHALGARSAAVFLLAGSGTADERWVRAGYQPEAPSFDEGELDRVWTRIRDEGRVWSRNEELNESALPRGYAERLERLGVALAVPVTTGQGTPVGLIALGRKARRFAVYNVEDVDRLRALAGGLALAVERLRLLDRERALVRQTAEAELATLRAQINPHFLFNALNTVAALIGEQPDEAEQTVEHLAGLFRDVLTASGQALVPLRDEVRLVERYLAVEKARFGDQIEVSVEVEGGAGEVEVPAFAVQTLVENAVKHGVERRRGGGRVSVRARVRDGALVVDVEDTGAGLAWPAGDGLPDDPTAFYGVGLRNVSDRLHQLYGDAAELRLAPATPGTHARIVVPVAAPPDPAPA